MGIGMSPACSSHSVAFLRTRQCPAPARPAGRELSCSIAFVVGCMARWSSSGSATSFAYSFSEEDIAAAAAANATTGTAVYASHEQTRTRTDDFVFIYPNSAAATAETLIAESAASHTVGHRLSKSSHHAKRPGHRHDQHQPRPRRRGILETHPHQPRIATDQSQSRAPSSVTN